MQPTFSQTVSGTETNPPAGSFGGTPDNPYTASAYTAVLNGSGEWQTETFDLTDARFLNRQNNRAYFRLRVNCPEFYVRKVKVAESDSR